MTYYPGNFFYRSNKNETRLKQLNAAALFSDWAKVVETNALKNDIK